MLNSPAMKTDESARKRISNPVLRLVVFACGWFFMFLALLGAILPLIPTTPFLLVAAACFYRSSEKFYRWIMYNRYFGHYLRDYTSGAGIPLKVKAMALGFMWLSTILSSLFFIPWTWMRILVLLISVAITVHLLMIKTRK